MAKKKTSQLPFGDSSKHLNLSSEVQSLKEASIKNPIFYFLLFKTDQTNLVVYLSARSRMSEFDFKNLVFLLVIHGKTVCVFAGPTYATIWIG